MKRVFFVALTALTVLSALPASVSLNDGWLFRHPCTNEWKAVNLPHTWNTDAYTVKNYCKGKGLYVRDFAAADSSRKYYLRLEGASKSAAVTVNGKPAGCHKGGYTQAVFNITPYLSFSAPNRIEIEVDNSSDDIPPVSGDFTFFGGLYRNVWMEDYAPLHFGVYGGVKVTPSLSGKASVDVDLSLVNEDAKARGAKVTVRLIAPDGTTVQTLEKKVRPSGGEQNISFHFDRISEPVLWSTDTPNLYTVEAVVMDRQGHETDRRVVHTAFRTIGFDSYGRFLLNGKPLKLRGVCRHQDMKPIGVALSDEMHRRDMQIIKDMGANFVRLAHYPQSVAVLDAADRLGLLVWEEIPVIDYVSDNHDYAACAQENLKEMIVGHYNHPSVITWGYMNEILLRARREGWDYDETLGRTLRLAACLDSVCHAVDPTRPTAMAFHGSTEYRTCGLADIPGINGWNLYQGWYGGRLSDFERFLSEEHRQTPGKPMIISEYGAGSDRRLHSANPQPFDFSIEYQQDYIEHYLPVIEDSTFVTGATYWNLIDFGSALREESMPRINNKGLLYADRTPKDVYHYFKAAWRDDIEYVYIASRDYPERVVVSDSATVCVPIKVYTNVPEVSLSVNGGAPVVCKVENNTAMFNMQLHAGCNTLVATGGEASDCYTIDIATVPEHISAANADDLDIAVNAGSGCSYISPLSGTTWVADRLYRPGSWGRIGGNTRNLTAEISGTDDGPLFQSVAEGIEGYRFDVPDGDYEIELGFADTAGKESDVAYLLGRSDGAASSTNVFDISVNGTKIESAFAPAAFLPRFAIIRKYNVKAKDGAVVVEFTPVKGKTLLNSIKIRKI